MSKLILLPAMSPIESACAILEGEKMHIRFVNGVPMSEENTVKENQFARFLVASYNACAETPIEILEAISGDFLKNVATQNNRLKAVNAQMLEALQKINGCRADGIAPDDPGGWMDFFIETARTAIENTTKTEEHDQEPDYDNQAKDYESDQRESDAPTPYDL